MRTALLLIALPEYALQVPANRFGHGVFTAPQLKILIIAAVAVAMLDTTPANLR